MDMAATATTDYLRDPAGITRRSFAIIRRETDVSALPAGLADVAYRMVHACGMTDLVADLAFSQDVAEKARMALAAGAPDPRRLPHGGVRHLPPQAAGGQRRDLHPRRAGHRRARERRPAPRARRRRWSSGGRIWPARSA